MIFKESALGRFFHRVAMSVIYLSVCLSPSHAIIFEASHWPSGHMIRSRPLIGRPPLVHGLVQGVHCPHVEP